MSLITGVERRPLEIGCFEITSVEGGLGAVFWNGFETLRGVNCLVRDANWGTYGVENFAETRFVIADIQTIRQSFTVNNNAADVEIEIIVDPTGQLEFIAKITSKANMMTNRAGLIILHPIAETAGSELSITHPDGSITQTVFPKLIAPSQLAANIAGLNHTIGDVNIDLQFEGDVFEMEDQRNWSDASFKTYCRPLSLPFPFVLKASETVRQTLRLNVRRAAGKTIKRAPAETTIGTIPEILLALEADWWPDEDAWPALKMLGLQGLLLRVHYSEIGTDLWQRAVHLAHYLGVFIDLELVISDESPESQIAEMAAVCGKTAIRPAHVMVLPEQWLKSYQPGQGPSLVPLEASVEFSKLAFPGSSIGAGMLTNFTELNRYPPKGGNYITHGNTAIVHAADDLSVWQTLEALPQIFASGKAIAGKRSYRLGLASIGMRTNPYGAALASNPDLQRKAMAGDDPRQQEIFAAGYAIGAAIEAAFGGVEALALAAPVGRFGVTDDTGPWPIFSAVQALAKLSGQKVKRLSGLPVGLTGIEAESGIKLIANCSPQTLEFSGLSLEPGASLMNGTRLC